MYYDLMKDVCNGRQGVVPTGKVADFWHINLVVSIRLTNEMTVYM